MIGQVKFDTSFSLADANAFKADADSNYLATTTSVTGWGFETFSIPPQTINLTDGEDIQTAIDNLTSGGTINLAAGDYYGFNILLGSNIVIQGAGENNTTIHFNGGYDQVLMRARGDTTSDHNIILRDFTADCTGTDYANGIEFLYGVDNVLCEDITVHGGDKSNLIFYNT